MVDKSDLGVKLDRIFGLMSDDQCTKGSAQSTNKPTMGAIKGTAPHAKKQPSKKLHKHN
jgi:hypothetical protein